MRAPSLFDIPAEAVQAVQDAPLTEEQKAELSYYPTPLWVAHAIVERHFPYLDRGDLVVEPSCGGGRFLQAIPEHVPAIGVEIDPSLAEEARSITGRTIITGDFRTVPLSIKPTAIIGNPPFEVDLIEEMLERSHRLLPEGGRVGFLLPAYTFQTAGRVSRLADSWSLNVELVPRNMYEGLKLPLCIALFSKDRTRTMIGLALYDETTSWRNLPQAYRKLMSEAKAPVWRTVIRTALEHLGGEADLRSIYSEIEGKRPTPTKFWREKIRQELQHHFVRVGDARYALPTVAAA